MYATYLSYKGYARKGQTLQFRAAEAIPILWLYAAKTTTKRAKNNRLVLLKLYLHCSSALPRQHIEGSNTAAPCCQNYAKKGQTLQPRTVKAIAIIQLCTAKVMPTLQLHIAKIMPKKSLTLQLFTAKLCLYYNSELQRLCPEGPNTITPGCRNYTYIIASRCQNNDQKGQTLSPCTAKMMLIPELCVAKTTYRRAKYCSFMLPRLCQESPNIRALHCQNYAYTIAQRC